MNIYYSKLFSVCSFLILFLFQNLIYCQNFWEPTKGPYGDNVYAIAINSANEIFIGTYSNGLFKSSDSGNTWILQEQGIQSGGTVLSLIEHNDNIYAGIWGNGLYVLQSGSGVWENKTIGLSTEFINSVAVNDSGIIFTSCNNDANPYYNSYDLFVSNDTGNTWTQLIIPDSSDLSDVYVDRFNILYAYSVSRIYRSYDNGATWFLVGIPSCYIEDFCVIDTSYYVVASSTSGIKRTTDGGLSWVPINSGLPSNQFYTLASDNNGNLFAGSLFAGVFMSVDSGNNWVQINTGLTDIAINKIIYNNGNLFAGTRRYGLHIFENASYWRQFPISNIYITSICANPLTGTVFATGRDGFYKSIDSGYTWIPLDHGSYAGGYNNVNVNSAGVIFVGTSNGVYKSYDDGNTWIQSGLYNDIILAMCIDKNDVIYVCGENYIDITGRVYKSTDGGNNWTLLATSYDVSFNLITVNDSGYIYVSFALSSLFRSMDNGATWSVIHGGYADDLKFDPSGNIYLATGNTLLFSFDNGSNWSTIYTYIYGTCGQVTALALNGVYGIYLGTNSSAVLYSDDSFINILHLDSVIPNYISYLYYWHDNYIYAGTKSGVYRSVNTITSNDNKEIVTQFITSNPNPVNGYTDFTINLNKKGKVKLIIVGCDGKIVEEVINKEFESGEVKIKWFPKYIPKGIYFAIIETNQGVYASKMVLE